MSLVAAIEMNCPRPPRPLDRVEGAIVNAAHRRGVPRADILDVKRIKGRWKVWILNKGWRELAEIGEAK